MKQWFRYALLLCLALPGSAWAADIAEAVKARLSSPQVLRGQFEQQKSVVGFKKPLLSSGEFLLWRGHGVLWQTRKPFESSLVVSPDKLSAESGQASYQLESSREPALQAMNELLFALLAGDVAVLQKRFLTDGGLRGKDAWVLALTPREPGLARVFKRVILEGERHVKLVRLEEANGDSSLIRFDKLVEASAPTAEEATRLGR
ncbi:outer-membrane lipoprotein carrier protein [Chitinimonas prasina]|uniref:Outer-membrane lipoprotein carrier protein n=1 Tax=Chitinimonas prasina TaxID=1434937 RepID=A0ABQ5YMQ6_9NEIS|nr:outer membrane lipoprotein carrier protein LolA [Chitinimonas prasina]GLR15042.1 outer-membrane lipoprotein carrier protein [Chitinimonas prasina]